MTTKRNSKRERQIEAKEEGSRHRPDELPPNQRGKPGSGAGDRHAAGAPMGGSAIGGLGGTNIGRGDPDDANIDAAEGSGEFDRAIDADEETAYSGRDGGAVGGTPANNRATPNREAERHPFVESDVGESTIGRDPTKGKTKSPKATKK